MFGLLAFLVGPAPNNRTAAEVSGILVSMSLPHPEYSDIKNVLDNRHRYYINRVSEESHLDWESRLVDVQPGDEIQLTVVKPLV
jgi:hypothetical protein